MKKMFLQTVSIAYIIFGLLWFVIPAKMLSLNTEMVIYDSIHIHMTRVFGLTLMLSAVFGIYATIKKDKSLAQMCLISYIIYNIMVIIYQFKANNQRESQWDKVKHASFGILGMFLATIVCLLGLFY
jgi:hypothetical protein